MFPLPSLRRKRRPFPQRKIEPKLLWKEKGLDIRSYAEIGPFFPPKPIMAALTGSHDSL